MIDKVSVVTNRRQYAPKKDNINTQTQPSFTGVGDILISGIQACEKEPMLNVTVLDLATAILPRTFFETFIGSKKKDENGNEKNERKLNVMGGFEAFRRESSGLLINCIIPSFIVAGTAALLKNPIMGDLGKNSKLAWCWANGDALTKIEKFYSEAHGATHEERVFNTLKNTLDNIEGVSGDIDKNGYKKFRDIFADDEEYITTLKKWAKNIVSKEPDKKINENAYKTIINKTGISENIKFAGDEKYFSNNLQSMCDSLSGVLHNVVKENIQDADTISKYFHKARKLVNWKSAAGLGVIIPLAISAQPINRWITHKLSGKKGAPLYNDDKERILTPEEKHKLTAQKFFAVPLMAGVAGLSMWLDRPSLKMFQFKNLFPTMDQARVISAATFSSRLAAAEDSNELKESTIRDIATFSSFYFLGDYAAKAIATYLDNHSEGSQLLTHLKNSDKGDNMFKRLWNWAKHTTIKSTDELNAIKDEALRTKNKRLRSICQLGNIAFSLISLGIFIPVYTRTQVNKKEREKVQALNEQNLKTKASNDSSKIQNSQMKPFKTPPFEAFFGS